MTDRPSPPTPSPAVPTPAAASARAADLRFEGRGLVCLRGERIVFANLDFALGSGEALLLLGPNGSGKSSLLRLMAGLLRPMAGALVWHDGPVRDEPERHHARTRYVGHADAVKPVLTATETLRFWARVCAEAPPSRADLDASITEALARMDLTRLADVPGRLLSAGQKRRLGLARLLAAPAPLWAPLWLMDEPTTALDRASVRMLEDVMAEHRARGGMIALSTHQDVDLPGARVLDLDAFAVDPLDMPSDPYPLPHAPLEGAEC